MDPNPILYLTQQVDEGRLREHVTRLATGERHSLYSPTRHAEAADYISTAFRGWGLATRQHTFDLRGRGGTNIIARKSGLSSDITSPCESPLPLLASAHYDTVPGSPGADDNASGVAALLECARVLSTVHLLRAVEFVAFDMEEKQPPNKVALVGSTAFVNSLLRSQAGGAVRKRRAYEALYNLEMVGYTSGPGTQGHPPGFRFILPSVYKRERQRGFRGDFIATAAQGTGVDLGRRFHEASGQWVPELELLPIEFRHRIPLLMDIFRSDHAPFWAAGIPAIMITDTANFRNPNYHRSTDTPDTLDYGFMGNVTRALVATLAQHAGLG